MKAKKSRVVLSSVSVLLVLSLLAGMTMAWFTDTEKVNTNFTAGVLDISVKPGDTDKGDLTFENLRPMLYDNFYKELEPNGNAEWVNDVTQDETTGLKDTDYAPTPAYFKPVVIKNEGTLPAKVKLSLEAGDGCEAGEPILTEDNITIKQDPEKMQACANRLAPVLKVFVYKLVDETWTKVEDVNLNTAYDEAKANPDKVASDNTAKETNNTYMTAMLPAQGTATYVIAGYLPETVNNAYQGQHFHSKLVLNAYQMDDTGAGNPDEGGSSSTDPEDPDRFNENVTIEWREETAEGDLVKSQNETVKSNATIAAVNYDAPEGYEYSPEAAEQKTDVVVDEKTGEATPGKVIFTVVPEETKNVEITVKYESTFDTEDKTDDCEIKTVTVSLAAPGEYTLVTGNTVQGRAARSNGDEPKEIMIPEPPAGFVYDPPVQRISIKVDAEGNVTPKEIIFKVRSEEANVVIHYVDQALVGTDHAIVGSYTDTVEATIGQEYTYSTDTPVVKDHLPEGYEFPTPGVSVKITYLDDFKDEDNTVDGKRTAYVMFVVKKTSMDPDPEEHPEAYQVRVDFRNQETGVLLDQSYSKTYSGLTKGVHTFTPVGTAQNDTEVLHYVTAPKGYEYDPAGQSAKFVTIPAAKGPEVIEFTVKPVGGTDPEEPDNPDCDRDDHIIRTAEDLNNVRYHMNCDFVVANDIDLSSYSNWEPLGWANSDGDTPFTGTFDGNGYKITGLTYNRSTVPSSFSGGLFAVNTGTIKNLTIENANIRTDALVGILVAQNAGTVENCHVSGTVASMYYVGQFRDPNGQSWDDYDLSFVGGIAGWNGGTISRCSSSAEAQHRFIGGKWESGGLGGGGIGSLVGVNTADGTIRESYSTGSVNSSLGEQACDAYNQAYGVLAGYNLGTVENCYVYTDTTIYGGKYTGGFIGSNDGTVRNCWSSVEGYTAYTPSHLCIGQSTYNVTGVYYETSKAQSGSANRNGQAIMKPELTSGNVLSGFDTSVWSFNSGSYPNLIHNPR